MSQSGWQPLFNPCGYADADTPGLWCNVTADIRPRIHQFDSVIIRMARALGPEIALGKVRETLSAQDFTAKEALSGNNLNGFILSIRFWPAKLRW